MLNWIGMLIGMLTLTTLGGCATLPTEQELAEADYGEPIEQEKAEALAQAWLAARLRDPDSARYAWESFSEGWQRDSVFRGGKIHYGYRLEGTVNARNAFGGYVGAQPYVFLFHNGQLEAVWGPLEAGSNRLIRLH